MLNAGCFFDMGAIKKNGRTCGGEKNSVPLQSKRGCDIVLQPHLPLE